MSDGPRSPLRGEFGRANPVRSPCSAAGKGMARLTVMLLSLLALGAHGFAHADEAFEHIAVRLEQNATDEDVEAVFEATSGDIGLAALRVSAPDGRTVIDFKSPDSKMGIRRLLLESPEPTNDGRLQKDFPAGAYTFTGSTVKGDKLSGKATLSHQMPGAASIVRPRPKEKNVPVKGLQLQWTVPKNLASCLIAIEDEESGAKLLQATLSGTATTLAVPDGLLASGREYKLEVGTVTHEGNRSIVESSFTTAGRK